MLLIHIWCIFFFIRNLNQSQLFTCITVETYDTMYIFSFSHIKLKLIITFSFKLPLWSDTILAKITFFLVRSSTIDNNNMWLQKLTEKYVFVKTVDLFYESIHIYKYFTAKLLLHMKIHKLISYEIDQLKHFFYYCIEKTNDKSIIENINI